MSDNDNTPDDDGIDDTMRITPEEVAQEVGRLKDILSAGPLTAAEFRRALSVTALAEGPQAQIIPLKDHFKTPSMTLLEAIESNDELSTSLEALKTACSYRAASKAKLDAITKNQPEPEIAEPVLYNFVELIYHLTEPAAQERLKDYIRPIGPKLTREEQKEMQKKERDDLEAMKASPHAERFSDLISAVESCLNKQHRSSTRNL